ncbi:MAG TPA: fibronectin type III domain-containing protein [Spirochaetota bacterium]|nr:fibronectin type III domain-containing protein [Spirochaetota bacterium]
MKIKHIKLLILKPLFLCLALLQGVSCWDGLNDMLEEAGSPSAITFMQSLLTSGGMTINWTDPVSVTGYDHILVTYTPGSSVTLNKGVTNFNVSGLSSSTEYTVTVQAIGKENIIKAQSSFKVTPSGNYTLRFIYTAADLDSVRSNLGYYYVVMNDLDLSGYVNWTPIGTFSGVFDGQDFNICNLTINSNSQYLGLFSNSSGTLKNSNISGTIAGSRDDASIGGLVGLNSGTVRNCSSSVSVTGSGAYCCLGGLAGRNDGSFVECYAIGKITGTGAGDSGSQSHLGGLVGINIIASATITRCYASGEVSGGLINCRYGGLVGTNNGPITDCYANVKVTASATNTMAGGLVGVNSSSASIKITNCYAAGSVSGSGGQGGLVGFNSNDTIVFSYYDSQTTGQSDTGKGEPRTTNQMKLIDTSVTTYSGWDFTTVWGISSGINGGYPYLRAVAP